MAMETPFKDKNGRTIIEGDTVKRTAEIRTGTSVSYYKRKRNTFAVYSKKEIIGTVSFGLFKHITEEICCFYIQTDQTTSYDSYFMTHGNHDAPTLEVDNLSCVLSTETAAECEVIVE